MRFYKAIYSETEDDVVVINDYDLCGFKYTDLLEGKTITHWDGNIRLYSEQEGKLEDYLANPLHWPILSQRFVALLDRLGIREIQYFVANIQNKTTGGEIGGYSIANITKLISALDWEKSDYEQWNDGSREIRSLNNLVIKESKVGPGAHLFRLAEYPVSLLLSEELKAALQDEKISGVGYLEVQTS